MLKFCSNCQQEKVVSEFHQRKLSKDGLMTWCKTCTKKANRESYVRNREVRLRTERLRWPTRSKERRKQHEERKQRIMQAYGDGVCACCKEGILRFLTLDHINNDGIKHREMVGSKFYKWLEDNNYPSNLGLRVLCYNCNCGRSKSDGYRCPHELIKE
jgi:hypothetical protein